MNKPILRGRFAPTPSGALHLGSLATAMFSYIAIRRAGGRWQVRIDDGDPLRVRPYAIDTILRQLIACGLIRDELIFQSQRNELYHHYFSQIRAHTYACQCTRAERSQASVSSPPLFCACWNNPNIRSPALKLRLRENFAIVPDRVGGDIKVNFAEHGGDFLIRRQDGRFAYQFMSGIDDALEQGITEVVRGADLIDSSARQIALQKILGLHSPQYQHLPLLVLPNGRKLSKSEDATPINPDQPLIAMKAVARYYRQPMPPTDRVPDFMQWAIAHWSLDSLSLAPIRLQSA